MTRTGLKILTGIVPDQYWQQMTLEQPYALGNVSKEALRLEVLLSKKVNVNSYRQQYQVCCRQIENNFFSLLLESKSANEIEYEYLDDDYKLLLEILLSDPETKVEAQGIRLCKSFFAPDEVDNHLTVFADIAEKMNFAGQKSIQRRLELFQKAHKRRAGIIELPVPYQSVDRVDAVPKAPELVAQSVKSQLKISD
ncbi:MAG: hypothetical protein HZA82_03175, partial [Thaumarchaeota archaeon]|nr:hypothetical protein [Nitrososphaerota archaeon]